MKLVFIPLTPASLLLLRFNLLQSNSSSLPSSFSSLSNFLYPTRKMSVEAVAPVQEMEVVKGKETVSAQPSKSLKEIASNETKMEISDFKRRELAGELSDEPLLMENEGRYVIFPITSPKIWEMHKKAVRML